MNDQITLDHPSCHPVTGWFRASGEWEASSEVSIRLIANGRGNGIGIDWDYAVCGVELWDKASTQAWMREVAYVPVASVYCADGIDLIFNTASVGVNWTTSFPTPLSETSKFWMLGVAYCWAVKNASDWANVHAEKLPE